MVAPMIEFEVDGVAYKAKRLDAVSQMILNIKLVPLLAHMDPIIGVVRERAGALSRGEEAPDLNLDALEPVATALARIPEDVQRSILRMLLQPVFQVQGPGVIPIWDAKNDQIGLPDINGLQMLKIAWRVFEENLGSFFGAAGRTSPSAPSA